ncbi:MAG: response regulator transcription factor [Chitinophagaceae bacterium]|nr:response regulator transcription factor [Chitinophagaceae bacterium]
MKVIIIEDERLSAEHLLRQLKRLRPDVELLAQADTVREAVQVIGQHPEADMIFLDIHLADGISFELFSQIQISAPVIFTTAYDQYAVRAFRVNGADYLLKPINTADLSQALEKVQGVLSKQNTRNSEWFKMALSPLTTEYKSRFMVRSGQVLSSIPVEDIKFFLTRESISFLVTATGKKYPVDYTLDELEHLLSPVHFFRMNRKTLLNIRFVQSVVAHGNGRLLLEGSGLDGDYAIVSRERVNDFKRWLDQ